MANSGTFDGLHSTKYNTACWRFNWTQTILSPGQSRINWDIYTVGRSSTPTILNTGATITVVTNCLNPQNVTAFDFHKSFSNTSSEFSFKDKYRGSGYATINHFLNGTASFTVTMTGFIFETAQRSINQTFYLDNNYSGAVWIYNGGWKRAIPYVYSNGGWHQAIPYVYSNGGWHICG